MFDLDDLEAVDPSPNEITFSIGNEELVMQLPRCKGVTAQDLTAVWETEWGVCYANRLRFLVGTGNKFRSLNPRQDTLPPAVKLEGPGSVLTAVAIGLRQRGGGPAAGTAAAAPKADGKPTSALPKKAGLGPVQREAFRHYQAGLQQQAVEAAMEADAAEAHEPAPEDSRRQEREVFLRNQDARRREESDRWAREEARWASNRRGRSAMN